MKPNPQQLFDQVQFLIAGHEAGDVCNVLLNSLVVLLMLTQETVEDAEDAAEKIFEAIKGDLRESWSEVRNDAVRVAAAAGST